jgi:hypothetical protein
VTPDQQQTEVRTERTVFFDFAFFILHSSLLIDVATKAFSSSSGYQGVLLRAAELLPELKLGGGR